MDLATIGYERRSLPELIEALKSAGVRLLVDVRAVAASRRAGFSKGVLSASLKEAGIGYLHLRALGTPKEGRQAARAGRTEEMRRIFSKHLEEPEAQLELMRLCDIARLQKTALLCFEAEAKDCHRSIVAARVRAKTKSKIRDL